MGKTTVILKLLTKIRRDCDGFYTEEIREKGIRVGFRLVTLSGEAGILAHKMFQSPYRVGKYGVNIECLEKLGIRAIEAALARDKIVIIDEIGKMELFSNLFREAVITALNSKPPLIATIMYHPHLFCNQLKNRPDVILLTVTISNRDELPEKILAILAPKRNGL